MELPPAKSRPRPIPHHMEGRVLLVQLQELENHRRAIPDFTTWAQCFAIYAAAILSRQPHRMADLMAYMVETANNVKKYRWPSWLVYDQNFRQQMAARKDEVWAKTDVGIYAQCFMNQSKSSEAWCRACQSIEHNSSSCPLATVSQMNRLNQRQELTAEQKRPAVTICKNFNSKGCKFNSNCYRRHVCLECQGAHPKSKCPNLSNPTVSTR